MKFIYQIENLFLELPIGKTQEKRSILKDIHLTIESGKIYTIVGASGCGKTSLLRVMGGLTQKTSGKVLYQNTEVTSPPEGVAFVFQDYANALLPWRTVAKNISLPIEDTLSAVECSARVKEAISQVHLTGRENDYPWQLSGGMQQRLQIARALATKPNVLLMDEPFAALDAMTKASMQDELLKLRDQTNISIVFITHDIEEAIYLGDQVSIMRGPPGEIFESIDISLSQNRDQLTTRGLPEFLAYRKLIHESIKGH